jgi:hypothetical protein
LQLNNSKWLVFDEEEQEFEGKGKPIASMRKNSRKMKENRSRKENKTVK